MSTFPTSRRPSDRSVTRRMQDRRRRLLVEILEGRQLLANSAMTFTVTDTSDSATNTGSLLYAVDQSNLNTGSFANAIDFAGSLTIKLTSILPMITQRVVIDGVSQSGTAQTVTINGSSVSSGGDGFEFTSSASKSIIEGLTIEDFPDQGVELLGSNDVTIGGTAPGAGNVIGNNATGGVYITNATSSTGGTTSDVVEGNYIGTDPDGDDLENMGDGVLIDHGADGNTVGGTAPGAGNVIGDNEDHGVNMTLGVNPTIGLPANDNVVQGNDIGTNASGAVLANGLSGVAIAGTTGNTVGGTATRAGNTISGNANEGVVIDQGAQSNVVEGNDIGTEAGGQSPLGNREAGVAIEDSSDNTVGGTSAGAGNTIAFNTGNGVTIGSSTTDASATGNLVVGNVITGNKGLGIDVGDDGVTNDDTSGHIGPNDFQDFPVLTAVTSSAAATTVSGTFDEAAEPDTTLLIAFYTDPTADPSGYGQAAALLGTTTITTDGSGQVASFSVPGLTLAGGPVPLGDVVTATTSVVASPASGIVVNDTSEFSADVTVNPDTPVFSALSAPTATYGTATTLSGQIAAGTLIPSGSVAITLGGVTQEAPIDPATGDFSAVFTTGGLGVAASPYTISYTFAGNANLVPASTTTALTVNQAAPTLSGLSAPTILFSTPMTTLSGQIGAGTLVPSSDSVAITLDGVTQEAPIDPTTGDFSAAFTTGALGVAASPYSISYSFAGDTNFAPISAATTLTVNQAQPTITWDTPAAITYGTALTGAQLDANASVAGNDFIYSPPAGTILNAGTQQLSVTFTPADTTDYTAATGMVPIVINPATPTFSNLTAPQTINYGTTTVTLGGTLAAAGPLPATGNVLVTLNGDQEMAALDSSGNFSVTFNTATLGALASAYPVTYSYTATENFAGASDATSTTVTVNPGIATLSLSNLAQIYSGAPEPVTVTTTPPGLSGVVVTYDNSSTAPANAGNYAVVASLNNPDATATPVSEMLVISPATPTFSSLTAPQTINYGIATVTLGGTLAADGPLPATGNVLVTFNGDQQTVGLDSSGNFSATFNTATLGASASAYPVTYSYTATENFAGASDATSTTVTVNPAIATLSLSNLAQTYSGVPESVTVTTVPPGLSGVAVTYDGSATAPTSAGSYSVAASVTNPNYTGAATGTLVINQATPTITWNTPAPITYGTPLSKTQLDATASVAGTSFVYSSPVGTILSAGNQRIAVTFTPADTTDYTTATGTVQIIVNPASATLTLGNFTQTYSGAPEPVTVTTSPPGLSPVTITYNGSSTAPTSAGSYSVVASLTNPNDVGTATGTLVISPATPTITWNPPAAITYGTALGSAQLDAMASVPGTYTYTPAAGTVVPAGQGQVLSVTFTPNDPTDYTAVTHTTAINVVTPPPPVLLGVHPTTTKVKKKKVVEYVLTFDAPLGSSSGVYHVTQPGAQKKPPPKPVAVSATLGAGQTSVILVLGNHTTKPLTLMATGLVGANGTAVAAINTQL